MAESWVSLGFQITRALCERKIGNEDRHGMYALRERNFGAAFTPLMRNEFRLSSCMDSVTLHSVGMMKKEFSGGHFVQSIQWQKAIRRGVFLMIMFATYGVYAGQQVLYVDAHATGANNGSNWCDAYVHLQEALTAASSMSVSEIRVADGMYLPDQGPGQTAGDQQASFTVPAGVTIRGGYEGCDAAVPGTGVTVFSGDLIGDDAVVDDPGNLPGDAARQNNAYVLVTVATPSGVVRLENLNLVQGLDWAVECEGGVLEVESCHFTNATGGAISVAPGSELIVRQSTFSDTYGDQVSAESAQVLIEDCTFERVESDRGAVRLYGSTSVIRRTDFFENESDLEGMAVTTDDGGTLTIEDCEFRDHAFEGFLGSPKVISFAHGERLTLIDSDFVDNPVTVVYVDSPFQQTTTLEIQGCYFDGNRKAFRLLGETSACMANSTFVGNDDAVDFTGAGGSGEFWDCSFIDQEDCAVISSQPNGSFTFRDCQFTGSGERAVMVSAGGNKGNVAFERCEFCGNGVSSNAGGAVEVNSVAQSSFNDCLFDGNVGPFGAAVAFSGDSATLLRCRFQNNLVTDNGGVVGHGSGTMVIRDCQFVGNGDERMNTGRVVDSSAELLIEGSLFERNHAVVEGVAISFESFEGSLNVDRCQFLGNTSNEPLSVVQSWDELSITNSAFVGNGGDALRIRDVDFRNLWTVASCTFLNGGGAAVRVDEVGNNKSTLAVVNSIVRGNQEGVVVGRSVESEVTFSNVEGGMPGMGNIDEPAGFVRDPAPGKDGMWGNEDDDYGDLRLVGGSPCIDAGDPAYMPAEDAARDVAGHARVLCGRVDIGAHESGIGDVDCNGSVDLLDCEMWGDCLTPPGHDLITTSCRAFDYDGDEDVDLRDFAGYQSGFDG